MKSFVANYGDEGKKELNSLASKHQVGLEYDDTKKFSYCGPVIKDGRLVVLFSEKMLGTNCNYCLEDAPLQQALNEAPAAGEAKMSYKVRTGIKKDYEAKEEEMRKNIAKQINCEAIKLNPNFEANYAVLSENAKASGIREDWEDTVGRFTMSYFGGLEYWLRCQQFEKDDMLQEGFQEAISKNEIKMVVVKQLETKQSSYNEAVIKDGVLCLQVRFEPSSILSVYFCSHCARRILRTGEPTLITLARSSSTSYRDLVCAGTIIPFSSSLIVEIYMTGARKLFSALLMQSYQKPSLRTVL